MIPVLLSGGSGTRLWPASRTKFPKQFANLFEDKLFISTFKRLQKLGPPMVLTAKDLKSLTDQALTECGVYKETRVIYEPMIRNTAPAVATLCRYLQTQVSNGIDPKSVVGVFPSDHLIENAEVFQNAVMAASLRAAQGKVVTLGISPTTPETGFGYIQTEKTATGQRRSRDSHEHARVVRFHEKPDLIQATRFLQEGNYFWNAGIFVFRLDTMIQLFAQNAPDVWKIAATIDDKFSNLDSVYKTFPNISIDYAVIEKTTGDHLECICCHPGWSDVGSWDTVVEAFDRQNLHPQESITIDAAHNFVVPYEDKTYALIDVKDLIVVDTGDALLVTNRGSSQRVREVVEKLKLKKPQVVSDHLFDERPWGNYEILKSSSHFKLKRIVIKPNSQISYQSHKHREEHWLIVKGKGTVVLNEENITVSDGTYVKIPKGAKHRIRNDGKEPLEFVEVQLGESFLEEDIVRYQDDYGRS